MGFDLVKVQQHPAKGLLGLDARGLEAEKVFNVAPLVAAKRGAEFEQDEPLPADEADLEIAAEFSGVEVLPESIGKLEEIEPM